MIEEILQFLTSGIVLRALIGVVLIALVASTSGTFLVFRGLSFMTSGVAHAALGGAALGLFLQYSGIAPWFDPILGALLFSVFVAVVTGYAGETGLSQKMEVAIGVSFALSMSIAVFLMYYIPPTQVPQIWGYLIGDILLLDNLDIILLAGTAVFLILITLLFHKEFVYVSVDMEGSLAHGLNARAYHYLMLISSALAIAFATKAVGAILVYAILVAPAAASNEVAHSVKGVMLSVFGIALLSELAGLGASFSFHASPSAIAGIIAALSYVVAIQIKKMRERVDDGDLEELLKAELAGTMDDSLSIDGHE
ncbi:MAG: metal ABC transporter permease [Candidatus Thorarchaeota archaeon]|nr:metal ABC transporter permease [Candidatus Thorarchaeota archaeon]